MKTKLFIAIIVFVALSFFAIPSESASAATLTITISGGGAGSSVSDLMYINCPPTCSYNYASGAFVELFYNAGSGYIFTGWTGNADCSDGVVSMSSNKACTANFSVAYTLTVVRTPAAGGRIDSGTGISCPATCSAAFASGYSVMLTATPFATYTFTGWSGGGCSGTGTCTVTMNSAQTVTANFALAAVTYTLTVSKNPSGGGFIASSPSGIDCYSTCSSDFTSGSSVTLTATPFSGYTFSSWSGDADCSDGVVTMNSAKSCTANFGTAQYTLTANKNIAAGGTITSNPADINFGATCSYSYNFGTSVTLTAAANIGYTFTGWSGGGCSGTGTCTVTVSSSQTVTANFSTFSGFSGNVVSSSAGISCGSYGSGTCSAGFNFGTVRLCAFTDYTNCFSGNVSGYTFQNWTGPCAGSGYYCTITRNSAGTETTTVTFSDSSGNVDARTMSLCFSSTACSTFTLTANKNIAAGGTVTSNPAGINCGATCSYSYNSGTSVTLTAAANTGYTFSGWSGGGCSGTGTCTVTMSADRAITANFTLSYASCGLRAYDGSAIITFACEPTGTVTSLLRIFSSGNIYGIMLVDPTDASASKFRIRTSAGIRALMKL